MSHSSTIATSDQTAPIETPARSGARLESIDLVRGAVMVIMLLDHVREFVGTSRVNPTDLEHTTIALFLTRWITHFCAPAFVFLAGTSAYLAGMRGKSRSELARFLFTRGLWLIVLEVTVVRFGLTFDPAFRFIPLTVIWVIGVSMVVLSGLIFLPTSAIAAFGIALIAGHNVFDGLDAARMGSLGGLWRVLHQPGPLGAVWGRMIFVLYPLVPWVGVMAAGYALGAVYRLDARQRRALLFGLGLVLTLAFVILRASNLYGNPRPWSPQSSRAFTVLSFLNCDKYPPSLLFLLMTLGPLLAAVAVFDAGAGKPGRPLVTLGRVPLFFFTLQWYLIHGLAILVAWATGQPFAWLIGNGPFDAPAGYGHGLPFVYATWLVCLALLYPPCAWFAALRQRRRDAWLSYL
jgi:uncharacterized membrane protein